MNRLSEHLELELCYEISGGTARWPANRRQCTGFRLPTEAEWEYAAQQASGEAHAVAWYDGNSNGTTHPVRQKQANDWYLHDLYGNVAEWVWDEGRVDVDVQRPLDPQFENTPHAHTVRGGSYSDAAASAARATQEGISPSVGVRCARSVSIPDE